MSASSPSNTSQRSISCESALLRRYIAGTPHRLQRDVYHSVHHQIRCLSDYPILYDTYLKDLDSRGGTSGGSSVNTVPSDEQIELVGESHIENDLRSSSSLSQQMQHAYVAKDVMKCILIADEMISKLSAASPYIEAASSTGGAVDIDVSCFEKVMELCLENSPYAHRVEEFYAFLTHSVHLSVSPASLMIVCRALCSNGKFDEALQIIQRDLLDSAVENDVLRSIIKLEQVEAICKPIIYSLVSQGQHEKVATLLNDLLKVHLASNGVYASAVDAFTGAKNLEACLLIMEMWTSSGIVLEGKGSSDACQAVFRLIWSTAPGTRSRPIVERWAISQSLVETMLQRGTRSDVIRDTSRLYIQQIVVEKPTAIQQYLTLLLAYPTEVGQWKVF